ncbi:ribonuclease H-like domain-containing protein [Tanacetum coccineum]
MVIRNQDGTRKTTQRLNLYASHISHVPQSPSLALYDPYWLDVMYDEYNALIKMYKSGLVALGSSHQLGIDSDDFYLDCQAGQHWDDSVLTTTSTALLHKIIFSLHSEFDMTYLGALNYFLGISITRDTTRMFLSQKKYAMELLEERICSTAILLGLLLTLSPSLVLRGLQFPILLYLSIYACNSLLYASSRSSLVAYSDVDWAGFRATR